MRRFILLILCIPAFTGCASSPDKMTSSYISPIQYADYNCRQIGAELQRVNRRASDLYGHLKQTADNDNAQMAVGMVLFWPALFFLEGGDGPEAAEYTRLKGERDALEQVAVKKNCDPAIIPPAFTPPPPKKNTPDAYPQNNKNRTAQRPMPEEVEPAAGEEEL